MRIHHKRTWSWGVKVSLALAFSFFPCLFLPPPVPSPNPSAPHFPSFLCTRVSLFLQGLREYFPGPVKRVFLMLYYKRWILYHNTRFSSHYNNARRNCTISTISISSHITTNCMWEEIVQFFSQYDTFFALQYSSNYDTFLILRHTLYIKIKRYVLWRCAGLRANILCFTANGESPSHKKNKPACWCLWVEMKWQWVS